jgi:dienelactone hydrolase
MVVHGGAGLDDHARNRTLRFAESGYVAFACDMYGDAVVGDRRRIMQQIAEFRGNPGTLCQRARAGLTVLKQHPSVDGRIAAVGYCFGGMTVLELARNGENVAAVVSVHGALDTVQRASPGGIRAKVLVCHGAIDPHVPMAHVTSFVEEMGRAEADWQLIVYGGAMHGFTHETATGKQPGVAYHGPSDMRSSIAIQTFLGDVFKR